MYRDTCITDQVLKKPSIAYLGCALTADINWATKLDKW
jgi:hypothetical protein